MVAALGGRPLHYKDQQRPHPNDPNPFEAAPQEQQVLWAGAPKPTINPVTPLPTSNLTPSMFSIIPVTGVYSILEYR